MKIILYVLKCVISDQSFNPDKVSFEELYRFNHPFDGKFKVKLEAETTNFDVTDFLKLHGSGSSLFLNIDYNKIPDLRSFQIFINGITHSDERIKPFSHEGILKQNDFLEIIFKDAKGTSLTHINIFVTYVAQNQK